MLIDNHIHLGRGDKDWNYTIWRNMLEPYGTPVSVLEIDPEVVVKLVREAGLDKACLLALDARAWKTHIPNDYVASIVKQYPDLFIGFASVDPNMGSEAAADLDYAYHKLGLRGLKLAPCYQMYHPADPIAFPTYAKAEALGMPILIHQAWTRMREAPMKWQHPVLLDDVAMAFPKLRIILAHIGLPWQVDCLHLVAKHPHLYVDISARDAVSYGGGLKALFQELKLAKTLMILDKVIYGSDYPLADPRRYLDQIRNINAYAGPDDEPFTPQEIDLILGGNAERLFKELNIL